MRYTIYLVILWLINQAATQQEKTVLRVVVILHNNTNIDKYSSYLDTSSALLQAGHSINVTWIKTSETSSSGTATAQLTETSLETVNVIFTASSSCVTILKVSAAWNIPVFTWNCQETDLTGLSTNTLLSTHIRMDETIRSLIPYLQTLLLDVYGKVKIQTATWDQTLTARIVASRLKPHHIQVSNCQKCVAETNREVLVLMGDATEVMHSVIRVNTTSWKMVVLATYSSLTQAHLTNLRKILQSSSSEIHLIHPNGQEPLDQEDSAFNYFKKAVSLYMSFITHEATSRRSASSERKFTHHLLHDLKSKCFAVHRTEDISTSYQCFDENAWSVGENLFWRYKYSSCLRSEAEEFYSYSNLTHDQNAWKLQMIGCNDTQILLANSSKLEDEQRLRENLVETMTINALYLIIGVLLVVILVGVIVLLWWKLRKHHAMAGLTTKPTWHVNSKDITLFECDDNENPAADNISLYSQAPAFITDNEKLDAAGKGTTTDFGYFRDQPVCMKKIGTQDFQPTKQQEKELENMVSTHHENLTAFYGVCVKPSHIILVTQYCIKGSLEEIFLFEPVHIDETFIASIVMDIIRGMTFLHKTSSIGVHGNLKSSNCLVTGRWVVKLSGFGLTELRNKYREERDLLWSAPEVIKETVVASQKADVYSFGVILYEVIGKQGPFGKSYAYTEDDIQALITRISEYRYHPETSWLCCEDYLKNVMLSCWQSPPKMRPDFQTLSSQLKPFRAIMNGRSIVDNMLVMMERYQMRLEDLVEEKTSQLQQEKRTTENLLHRMLPPQVADQLVCGKKVAPESFSCITVFFSDICGFTSLASTATPIQVIQMLNDLYTLFDSIIKHYDVYKVETVGDAYLCVSGLPRPNGDQHAVEIALMALEFIQSLKSFRFKHKSGMEQDLQMRIGIHSGQCVAGVVGVSMPRYTLFGDTINVASRLETTSEPMKIQISTETKRLLDKQENYFICDRRGLVNLKGKGDTETWWLESTATPIPAHSDYTPHLQPAGLIADKLQIPGANSAEDGKCSATSSELDLLKVRSSISRTRSNSIKSHNSSSKCAQVFQRAGSFRHKIKSDSLSNTQASDDNICKKTSGSMLPAFLTMNEEKTRLLGPASITPKHSFSNNSTKIVIQVDAAD